MLIPSYRHVDATTLSPKMVLPFSFETAEMLRWNICNTFHSRAQFQKCADSGAPGAALVCTKEANLPIFCHFHCRVNRPWGS